MTVIRGSSTSLPSAALRAGRTSPRQGYGRRARRRGSVWKSARKLSIRNLEATDFARLKENSNKCHSSRENLARIKRAKGRTIEECSLTPSTLGRVKRPAEASGAGATGRIIERHSVFGGTKCLRENAFDWRLETTPFLCFLQVRLISNNPGVWRLETEKRMKDDGADVARARANGLRNAGVRK